MNDKDQDAANADQVEFWNSAIGRKWVEFQEPIDVAFQPVGARLIERANPQPGERVIDIGCGSGAVSLDFAARVGGSGKVLGVDISRVLLDRAEQRSEGVGNVEYLLADAQTHNFEEGGADLLISRFGVMFFNDPVAAFRNMAKALRPGGRMVFVAWTKLADNPWFSVSLDVAAARLGPPPPVDPHAPSPFAFADSDRVLNILRDAGWKECSVEAERIEIAPGGLEHSAGLASNMGPAARLIKHYGGGPEDVRAIEEGLTEALTDFVVDGVVKMPVNVIFFEAVRPAR